MSEAVRRRPYSYALWLKEEIETGRWGNGAEEAPYSPDSESLLISEIMKDDSDRERMELKGQTRHAHLDMDGMESSHVALAPRPMDPIMAVMVATKRCSTIFGNAETS